MSTWMTLRSMLFTSAAAKVSFPTFIPGGNDQAGREVSCAGELGQCPRNDVGYAARWVQSGRARARAEVLALPARGAGWAAGPRRDVPRTRGGRGGRTGVVRDGRERRGGASA